MRVARHRDFLILLALFLVVGFTHVGAWSPYTYCLDTLKATMPPMLNGMPVNWDTPQIQALDNFFAFGDYAKFDRAMNIPIPLHGFILALLHRLTHNLFVSCLFLNFAAFTAMLWHLYRLARGRGLPSRAILAAGAPFVCLPWVAHYVSQPMQYVFGVSLTFIIMTTLVFTPRARAVAWKEGLLLTLVFFSYDPYAYVVAFALYAWITRRYETWRDAAQAVIAFAAPILLWRVILACSPVPVSKEMQHHFIDPILAGWRGLFIEKGGLLALHGFGQIAIDVAVRQISAQIYWPLLLGGLFALLRTGLTAWPRSRAPQTFAACLLLAYFGFAVISAPFDWENNPRRAFPAVLAFFLAVLPLLPGILAGARGRLVVWGLATLAFVEVMADRIFGYPNIALLLTGEYVSLKTHFPLDKWSLALPYLPTGVPLGALPDFFEMHADVFPDFEFSAFWLVAILFVTATLAAGFAILVPMARATWGEERV